MILGGFGGFYMKKRIFSALFAIILIASAVGMTACAGTVYDQLANDGYSVKVTYDAGGAAINETQDVTIVEVFNADDLVTRGGKTGIAILAPEDARRGSGVFKLTKSDETTLYYQVGWYTERELRFDENGQALDVFGVPVSESGREQGYVYSGKWDFDKDLVDPETLENGEFTLYAAWIPAFTYEFYAQNESGAFEKIGSVTNKFTINYPKWNDRKEEFDMKDYPGVEGKVFAGAYLDEAMTVSIEGNLDGREVFIDLENGIVESAIVKIYITWAE